MYEEERVQKTPSGLLDNEDEYRNGAQDDDDDDDDDVDDIEKKNSVQSDYKEKEVFHQFFLIVYSLPLTAKSTYSRIETSDEKRWTKKWKRNLHM